MAELTSKYFTTKLPSARTSQTQEMQSTIKTPAILSPTPGLRVIKIDLVEKVPKRKLNDIIASVEEEEFTREGPPVKRIILTSTTKTKISPSLPELISLLKTSDILSPFRRSVLLALLQVPPGRYSTYAALSFHLSSSPRAVGNALRNNPYAPEVPCHRILAADGTIGGYKGENGWTGEGELVKQKRSLLREEGVKFDGKGRALGGPFTDFVKEFDGK